MLLPYLQNLAGSARWDRVLCAHGDDVRTTFETSESVLPVAVFAGDALTTLIATDDSIVPTVPTLAFARDAMITGVVSSDDVFGAAVADDVVATSTIVSVESCSGQDEDRC